MSEFEIKLNGVEYKVSSTSSNGQGEQSWTVEVNHGSVRTRIDIPQTAKITRAKVMLFVEAFHVAMHKAFEEQKIDQNYIWNQKSSIQ